MGPEIGVDGLASDGDTVDSGLAGSGRGDSFCMRPGIKKEAGDTEWLPRTPPHPDTREPTAAKATRVRANR